MKEMLNSIICLTEENFQLFSNASKKKKAAKGELLFTPQNICRKILFIENGLLRGFKISEGKDFTHHFFSENWFATDFESFLTGKSGSLFVEALTPITYYEFQKDGLEQLYELHPQFQKLGRIIAEKAFLSTVEKLNDIQTLDLKGRYQGLVAKNKELFQKVPQKYIASYLGVSEQSLSRIKKDFFS